MKRSNWFISLLLLCLCLAPRPALANEFDRHYNRGLSLYKEKEYEDAANEFLAAYQIRQLPRILLNIGQAYRKLGKAREALAFYERYLKAEPDPPPKIKQDLDSYIAQTKALLDAPEVKAAIEQQQEPGPSGWNRDSGQMEPWLAAAIKIEEQNKPVYKKAWFWGIIGGSVAAVGLGVGLGVGLSRGAGSQIPPGIEIVPF